MLDRKIFSERLKLSRRRRNLTMVELGRAIGISKQAVHQWETMQNVPSVDSLIVLADILGCTIDFLVGRTDEQTFR